LRHLGDRSARVEDGLNGRPSPGPTRSGTVATGTRATPGLPPTADPG